jgi:hypothetical protein
LFVRRITHPGEKAIDELDISTLLTAIPVLMYILVNKSRMKEFYELFETRKGFGIETNRGDHPKIYGK